MFRHPHKRITINFDGVENMAHQSHKDECDIHKILNQYKKTGILAHITQRQPMYADLPDVSDYQRSLDVILEGSQAFATLPSSVRDRFSNDPAQFLAALGNPDLRGELEDLGVFKKIPVTSPVPASE
jgi:phage internal scaffolding protein